VTELLNETGESLREKGGEYGATTGRPRRCGWLDLVVVKQAVTINGLTDLALTKTDVLTGYEKLPVCVAYEIDGKTYETIPASLKDYARAKPVYKVFDGWNEDISGIRNFDDLPENAKKYINRILELVGGSLGVLSVGPARETTLRINI
jgi:adenylosuccinate synthase